MGAIFERLTLTSNTINMLQTVYDAGLYFLYCRDAMAMKIIIYQQIIELSLNHIH